MKSYRLKDTELIKDLEECRIDQKSMDKIWSWLRVILRANSQSLNRVEFYEHVENFEVLNWWYSKIHKISER